LRKSDLKQLKRKELKRKPRLKPPKKLVLKLNVLLKRKD